MRIDKWLYYARLYKTRVKSLKACKEGDVMVNKLKKCNISYNISANDIITLIQNKKIKIVKVLKLTENRVHAKNIDKTYEIIY